MLFRVSLTSPIRDLISFVISFIALPKPARFSLKSLEENEDPDGFDWLSVGVELVDGCVGIPGVKPDKRAPEGRGWELEECDGDPSAFDVEPFVSESEFRPNPGGGGTTGDFSLVDGFVGAGGTGGTMGDFSLVDGFVGVGVTGGTTCGFGRVGGGVPALGWDVKGEALRKRSDNGVPVLCKRSAKGVPHPEGLRKVCGGMINSSVDGYYGG